MEVLIELEECDLVVVKQKLIDIANGRWTINKKEITLLNQAL